MKLKPDARERLVILIARYLLVLFIISFGSLPVNAENGKTIVVFGDSLVAGYGLGPGESFPDQLQKKLDQQGHAIEIINAGVSGDTTTGGLSRLDWSIGDNVDGVILELGANDALRGIAPEISRTNLDAMITRLNDRNIDVLIAGMLAPPNMGKDYADRFNPIYATLAEKYDLILYPFFLDGVAADPKLNQRDGIHPTAEGIAIMVDKFMPFAEKFIARLAD